MSRFPTVRRAKISLITSLISVAIILIEASSYSDRITNVYLTWSMFYPATLYGLANSLIVARNILRGIRIGFIYFLISMPIILFYIFLGLD